MFNVLFMGVKAEGGRRLKFCKQFVVRQDGDADELVELWAGYDAADFIEFLLADIDFYVCAGPAFQ